MSAPIPTTTKHLCHLCGQPLAGRVEPGQIGVHADCLRAGAVLDRLVEAARDYDTTPPTRDGCAPGLYPGGSGSTPDGGSAESRQQSRGRDADHPLGLPGPNLGGARAAGSTPAGSTDGTATTAAAATTEAPPVCRSDRGVQPSCAVSTSETGE